MARPYKRRGMRKLAVDRARFRAALKRAGLNQSKLAKRMHWGDARVSELLGGKRGLQFPEALAMAGVLRMALKDLVTMFGLPEAWADQTVIVRGHVDELGEVTLYPESDEEKFERIQAPFAGYTGNVVRLTTSAFDPRYKQGEILAFTPGGSDFDALLGKEAFILLKGGALLLRVLRPGNVSNRFTLVGLRTDDPLIMDAELEWASKIDWHQP